MRSRAFAVVLKAIAIIVKMKKKYKKEIRMWERCFGTPIEDGAKEEIKRLKRRYNKHRQRNST